MCSSLLKRARWNESCIVNRVTVMLPPVMNASLCSRIGMAEASSRRSTNRRSISLVSSLGQLQIFDRVDRFCILPFSGGHPERFADMGWCRFKIERWILELVKRLDEYRRDGNGG